MNRPVRQQVLHQRLDSLVATFDLSTITPDPLQLVLQYEDPRDQEVAGLLAAAFAYGRAEIVVANVGRVLDRMRPSPYGYLAQFDRRQAMRDFAGFAHRFHKTPELVALLERLAAAVRVHGTLGNLFRLCYDDDDADIGLSLTRFVDALITPSCHPEPFDSRYALAQGRLREGPGGVGGVTNVRRGVFHSPRPLARARGDKAVPHGDPRSHASLAHARDDKVLRYLLSSPADGSACKRMNLFLRWMVRRTPPDIGIWDFVDPARLVMPVDTHIHRIATFLGLNRRKSADWKTARAITRRLAKFDAADPTRYDFAICRLGILDLCSRKRRKENCDVCLLRDVCRFPVR